MSSDDTDEFAPCDDPDCASCEMYRYATLIWQAQEDSRSGDTLMCAVGRLMAATMVAIGRVNDPATTNADCVANLSAAFLEGAAMFEPMVELGRQLRAREDYAEADRTDIN